MIQKFKYKLTIIFLIFTIVVILTNCLGYDDGDIDYGIFEGIPIIEIEIPENKSIIITEYPDFKWDTSRIGVSSDFPLEVVIIFDNEIEVDGLDFSETTKKDHVVWMWDSRKPEGTPGDVNLSKFGYVGVEEIGNEEYSFVYIPDPTDTNGEDIDPSLSDYDGQDFYWVVIQYGSDGKIKRASKQYRFTYQDTDIFDIKKEEIGIIPYEP